jgi:hypothetical protein
MITDKIRQGNLTALRRSRGAAFTATSCFISSIYGKSGDNLIEVYATDTAGNRSEPATTTITLF